MRDSLEDVLNDRNPGTDRAQGTPLSRGGRGRYVAAPEAKPRFASEFESEPEPKPESGPGPAAAAKQPAARPGAARQPQPSANPQASSDPFASNIQKAISAFKIAMPFVQKLLPLLDLRAPATPRPQSAPSALIPTPAQSVEVVREPAQSAHLAPIKESLNQLQQEQHELRGQMTEQNASLKRVEDRLDMVRQATDRNTLEQQELMDDLKSVGTRVNIVTIVMLAMLTLSLLLNLILYLHIQRVLP
ncbi:hypothetical protein ACOBR2_09470 [Telmatobacter bradus]|uniref:hypothetical protein n=1 Tax=Telmatobacter bradus TaxID=474953 RepID=UPI003B42958C